MTATYTAPKTMANEPTIYSDWNTYVRDNIEYLKVQVDTRRVCGLVSNPQAVYIQRPQVVMFRTSAAISITEIHIACSDYSPTAEMAGDLKWASDVNTGGFADAAVLHICDTTNGVFDITAHDLNVAASKFIYFQFDASPHADIKDIYIEFVYTVD